MLASDSDAFDAGRLQGYTFVCTEFVRALCACEQGLSHTRQFIMRLTLMTRGIMIFWDTLSDQESSWWLTILLLRQEVSRLKQWRNGLPDDLAAEQQAAEECLAREARAPALARQARADADSRLQQRHSELAQCVS